MTRSACRCCGRVLLSALAEPLTRCSACETHATPCTPAEAAP